MACTVRYCHGLNIRAVASQETLAGVLTLSHELEAPCLPRVMNGVRKFTPPDAELKTIVLRPFVFH